MGVGRTGRLMISEDAALLPEGVTATSLGWLLPLSWNSDVTAGAGPLSAAGTNNTASDGSVGCGLSCNATLPGATGTVARRGSAFMPGATGEAGAGAKPFTASGDEKGGGTRSRFRRRSRVLG